MLLPHGYEGQGPEHSNAYMERFLAACAEDNIQVCQPTHPHQYFHLLRRQQLRSFRKPLILFMPKSLLRDKASTSRVSDFTNSVFEHVLDDPTNPPAKQVRRLMLCTGKVYFALDEARRKANVTDVAIVRLEQLYPYPAEKVQKILDKYSGAREICWVQEEPRNRGAWQYMRDRLSQILPDNSVLIYVGRNEAASPSTGNYKMHQIEEKQIMDNALDLPNRKVGAAPVAPATKRPPVRVAPSNTTKLNSASDDKPLTSPAAARVVSSAHTVANVTKLTSADDEKPTAAQPAPSR